MKGQRCACFTDAACAHIVCCCSVGDLFRVSDVLASTGSFPELLELSVAIGRRAALFCGVCVPERTRVPAPRCARVCGHGTAARLRGRWTLNMVFIRLNIFLTELQDLQPVALFIKLTGWSSSEWVCICIYSGVLAREATSAGLNPDNVSVTLIIKLIYLYMGLAFSGLFICSLGCCSVISLIQLKLDLQHLDRNLSPQPH